MTATETTAPIGRNLADAGHQRAQLDRLLAWENGQHWYMHVDRDSDVLEQLVDAGYVAWGAQGYRLTDRGYRLSYRLAELDAYDEQPTEVIDAVEQTGTRPDQGTLTGEPTIGRHRLTEKSRTPGWLLIACLAVLAALDGLITGVSYRIARFATVHARGLAWLVIAVPALAAGLVLGTTGVLWVIR